MIDVYSYIGHSILSLYRTHAIINCIKYYCLSINFEPFKTKFCIIEFKHKYTCSPLIILLN